MDESPEEAPRRTSEQGAEQSAAQAVVQSAALAAAQSSAEAEAGDANPRWPAWYAPAGFALALGGTLLGAILLGVVARVAQVPIEPSPVWLTNVLVLFQDAVLLASAIFFASLTARPRLRHFGFRRTAFWAALGWIVLGIASFMAFSYLYGRLAGNVEQTTLDELGADRGPLALVMVGLLVVVLAPIVEEVFFRGFFYGALRTRLGVARAALITAAVFGGVHAGTGVKAVPPLMFLGLVFCLLYERTGSLFPPIALHALVNTTAYSVAPSAPPGSAMVAVPLGAAMIVGCIALARLSPSRLAGGRASPVAPAPG